MKKHDSKLSISLPPEEFKLMKELKKRTGAKSNLEVIRQGLSLLKSQIETNNLAEQFRLASEATRASSPEIERLDNE